ncbi:PhyH-domain-containing protein [Aspergillus egyptiacus]|nr:PhyH-domain-containing protein [Aspergillus egyptiacus]
MTVTNTSRPVLRRLPMGAGADAIFQVLQEDGCVIIEGFLTPQQVKTFNKEVDPHLKKWEMGQGSMQETQLANMKQLSSLPLFSKTFRDDLMNHELLHEICKKAFGPESGDYWLTTSSVLETDPGYGGQELHREHDGIPICTTLGRKSPEAMLNFLTALTDFTAENGATRLIPGSHLWEDFSQPPPSPDQAVPAEMNPGDAVLFSGKTLHGAGHNQTTDFLRRGFPLIMQSCQFTPVEASVAIPRSLVETMTPLAQKMVGWRSVHAKDVEIWTYDLKDLAKGLKLTATQPLGEEAATRV